ncbi:MAG TPA: hypothetical protein VIX63_15515 [Vicinamibacterales bacterium]
MAANSIQVFTKLLSDPQRWPALTTSELADLLKFGCVAYGTTADDDQFAQVSQLLAHVAEKAPVGIRQELVVDLGSMLERYARARGAAPMGALFPFVLIDPDFVVISTAALHLAQLMPLQDGDPLTGPRTLLEMAEEMREPQRQVAILAGLTALGDEEVFELLEQSWRGLHGDAQVDLVACMGRQPVTTAAVEFLLTRLERWIAEGHEGPIGHVVPTLIRLAQRAGGSPDRRRASETGVFDIERAFPSWSSPPDTNPISLRRTYSVKEFGRCITPRLTRLAELESYPRLLPTALRAWGADDGPLIKALRAAARTHFERRGGAQLATVPVGIEPVPDWDRDDCFLEWGVLDPFGPTKVQWCLVPLDRRTRALVYTLHNPFAPASLLLGIVKGGDSDTLRRMLLDLADRFELGDRVLLKGLPHWVKTTPVDNVQISETEGAVIFERLHKGALSRGVTDDANVAEQVRSLGLLREDPLSEINRQFVRALKQPRNPERVPGPDADDYLLWYRTASSSEHVRALTSCFMPCWNSALRLQLP